MPKITLLFSKAVKQKMRCLRNSYPLSSNIITIWKDKGMTTKSLSMNLWNTILISQPVSMMMLTSQRWWTQLGTWMVMLLSIKNQRKPGETIRKMAHQKDQALYTNTRTKIQLVKQLYNRDRWVLKIHFQIFHNIMAILIHQSKRESHWQMITVQCQRIPQGISICLVLSPIRVLLGMRPSKKITTTNICRTTKYQTLVQESLMIIMPKKLKFS